jgi:hypothetical protein
MDLVKAPPHDASIPTSVGLLDLRRPDIIDLTEPFPDDDGLASVRGMVAGVALSVPIWAGLGVVAWRMLH